MRAKPQTWLSRSPRLVLISAALLFAIAVCFAQSGPNPAPTPGPSGEDIIPFLNQTIVWSRQVSAEQQLVTEPSDTLFLNDSRQTADQVVRLAFDFARARAQVLAGQTGAAGNQGAASQYQRLIDSASQADQKVKSLRQELDGFRQQLVTASGRKRTTLQALISETE